MVVTVVRLTIMLKHSDLKEGLHHEKHKTVANMQSWTRWTSTPRNTYQKYASGKNREKTTNW